jgi:hypothetical protein
MSSNPKHIGPGYWANWHSISLYADTREKKAELARNIVVAVDKFPCREPCRKDAIKYIKSNPLLSAVDSKDPLSLFKWTVNFHNYVNSKLNKTIFTWVEAKEAWSGKGGICFENCGVSEDEIDREEKEKEKEIEIVIKGY